MTQHEPDGQREPDQARSDIRNGGPFDAKRRKRAETSDKQCARKNIHRVHAEACLHHIADARIAAQKRREGEESSLQNRGRSDNQQKR